MDVEYHPAAQLEVEEAVAWYVASDAPEAAEGLLEELREARGRIGAHPIRYPNYLHGTRRYVLERYPYSVVYRVLADRVMLMAVSADKRRPGYWRRRRVPGQ